MDQSKFGKFTQAVKQHPLITFGVLAVFYAIGSSSISDAQSRQREQVSQPVTVVAPQVKGEKLPAASHLIGLGEDGFVSMSGSTSTGKLVMLATEKDTYAELVKSIQIGDDQGVLNLVVAGKVFPLREGSTIKKIDGSMSLDKVRVLTVADPEQKHIIGKSGWVAHEFTYATK